MYVLSMPFMKPQQEGRPLPAGRAIANTHIRILDTHLQAVPIGEHNLPGCLFLMIRRVCSSLLLATGTPHCMLF